MINETARAILEKRYVRKDANGVPVESPEELFRRVAHAVSAPDNYKTEEEYYELMTSMDFLPNSPTLMNAGTDDGQLSACFVLPIEDSMEGIFGTLRDAALIHKTGGGTGFSFSRLRPSDSVVKSTGGVASGPISFMHAYDAATETVKQGGKRRGANMGMLRVDHPDILHFINCKSDLTKLNNFNISVAITDAFMKALEQNTVYSLHNPRDGKITGELSAKFVWDAIIKAAHATGEPGVVFIDVVNRFNPTPLLGDFEATNPCGEQPLLPYESCNLGSINLKNMFVDGDLDWAKLNKTIRKAVRMLDNVIEVNNYPLESIREATLKTRKIGLGVMGWADLLLLLKLPYDSTEARELAQTLMGFITIIAREESRLLGFAKGSFPAKDGSIWNDEKHMRHAAVTTIAPTGTISMIAGVSSGIEPHFGYAFTKTVMDNESFIEVNEQLMHVLKSRDLYTPAILIELTKTGRVSDITSLPDDVRELFVCAHDISPTAHIQMQAAFQGYTDNAISKTINFPKSTTVDDFGTAYKLAYELGCKGMTAYRDGSRDSQVLTMGTDAAPPTAKHSPKNRNSVLNGFTEKIMTGCGNLYVTINYDEHGPCEILTNSGKNGGCHSQSEATARLATTLLRSDVDTDSIIKQLRGIRCPSALRNKASACLSCPDGIGRVLKRAVESGLGLSINTVTVTEEDDIRRCPDCGTVIVEAEGCIVCPNPTCGYSKCG